MAAMRTDHLVYVTSDVDATTDELENQFGVRPAGGGVHVGRGTRNTLLALGNEIYLEVLGPDQNQEIQQPSSRFPKQALLRTWAVKAPQIENSVRTARSLHYDPGDVDTMSRKRPDGVQLEWRLTSGGGGGLGTKGIVEFIPFLIDWDTTEHPSSSAPTGCELISLRAEHPDPSSIIQSLHAINVELEIEVGDSPVLIATIETPKGTVELR